VPIFKFFKALSAGRIARLCRNLESRSVHRAAPGADRSKKQTEALRNAQRLIRKQRKQLERKDRKIEKQAKSLKNLRQQLTVRKRESKLSQHNQRIRAINSKLYTLGFTERAPGDLSDLARDDSEPALQEMAARELALWHANQRNEEGARRCLELLPLASRGEDNLTTPRQIAIMEAECQEILGNKETAREAILRALASELHADLFLANANLETSPSAKVGWINKALQLHGIAEVSLDDSTSRPLLDCLKPGEAPRERAEKSSVPKVSVIMPVYNAEDVLQTALDSVLSQTWSDLEVLIVDDCSSDATVELVEQYVRRDPRVRLLRTETNSGPYVARNLALGVATGEFVTCHDADDWSHPEKIERQARHLLENHSVIGNTLQQARATPELKFYLQGTAGYFVTDNLSSFMFRRTPVMEAIGYWDCVRFAADSEFIRRVKKVFGDARTISIVTGPLSFQRQSSSSLAGNEDFGLYRGYNKGVRHEYCESYEHFHDTAEDLRLEFPQHRRPFAVPEPMWPVREARENEHRHFDVILASDFRLPAGTTSSNVEEIKAQKRMGLRTGLVHMPRYDLNPSARINPRIRKLLDGDRVQMLVCGEKVSCDVLLLKHPPILQEWQNFVPSVEAANVHVIVNQTPMRDYGDEPELLYDIVRCKEHLQRHFGKAGVWHPIGPLVREALHRHHAQELTEITLADEDWLEIINVDEWRRGSRPPRGPRPRIGRHSRDHDLKWPADPGELLAIYPDSDDYEVHVLGGAEAPRKVLGRLPENWRVLEFGEVHPKAFLSTLDVFIYYTHPDLVEAFGRSIIEAMAVGVPVILPHSYRQLFNEAAIYAEPSEVKGNVNRLMSDDDYYQSRVRIARHYVEEYYGYTLHAARLSKQN
jgi:glycosyltransferase involved in cell wall biosynthesis